ncbi:hypothetical protein [Streptomyces sp. SGAir0957]
MDAVPHVAEGEPVGRCYTKARRSPLVHGVIRGVNGRGLRLPFGPYTMTQLGVLVAATAALALTRPLWGGHGPVDLVVMLIVPFAAALCLRSLHIDGRNPAAAIASTLRLLASSRHGRLRGRTWRPRSHRALTTRTACTLHEAPTPGPAGPERTDHPSASPSVTRHTSAPATPPTHTPVTSGVQALLARTPHRP